MSPKEREIHQILLQCLEQHYGIEGRLTRLSGENLNYRVDTNAGEKFVLKVVDDHMPAEVVAMEAEVIDYANSMGFSANLPGIIKTNREKLETRIEIPSSDFNRLRLIRYIDGIDLNSTTDISEKILKSVGNTVGEFNRVMVDYDHPAARRTHRWDMVAAGQHRKSVSLIKNRNKADLLEWAFDEWENRAAPFFNELPHQFIHGDINHENLMVHGEKITGLVDFGDACLNPTICELAICLAYMMMDKAEPMAAAETIIEAYEAERPLGELERQVLFPLVAGRLAVTIAIATRRKLIDPDNPTWFGSEEPAWSLLEFLVS